MQRRLLDVLADPDAPDFWPLKLEIFKSEERERKQPTHPHPNGLYCKFYCFLKDKYLVSDPLGDDEAPLPKEEVEKITTLDECYTCTKLEVIDGVLYHKKQDSVKWFMIDREIPVMYPLELREYNAEQEFIEKYKSEFQKLGIKGPIAKSK